MDENHPNRKKDKLNPYTLSIENDTYYIAFADGQGIHHKQEISTELYAAFNSFELDDISQMNVISRHLEQSELTEETLTNRAANPPGDSRRSCVPKGYVRKAAQGNSTAPRHAAKTAASVLFRRVHL